jgi:cbb3-type cytochrome oxidase maturation protein
MNSPMEGQTFLFIWIGFLLLMTGGIATFFLWGIRAGQFSDQDRARYLPLESGIPPVEEKPEIKRRRESGRTQS